MIDIKKYIDIYIEIKELQPNDILQLVLDTQSEDEKEFWELVGDFLLKKRQRQITDK